MGLEKIFRFWSGGNLFNHFENKLQEEIRLCWNDLESWKEAKRKLNEFLMYGSPEDRTLSFKLDPFKDAISLPGLAYESFMKNLPPFTILSLFDERNKDLYFQMRENLIAGPAIAFRRYAKRGDTEHLLKNGLPVGSIQGFDANSL